MQLSVQHPRPLLPPLHRQHPQMEMEMQAMTVA
jgi:hypothetical protein